MHGLPCLSKIQQYFNHLFEHNWTLEEGPGGKMQWSPGNNLNIFMLTTDLALAKDERYLPYAKMYAEDFDLHNTDFAKAWYRLTSSDMGPHIRCIGDLVPEPQDFQHNLPSAPDKLPDYVPVAEKIEGNFADDADARKMFIRLALNCASTFRATDYRGGCNGGRIRFPPQSEWETNAGLDEYVGQLEEIKTTGNFDDVSVADMIVLSGILALEKSNPGLSLTYVFSRWLLVAAIVDGSACPLLLRWPYILTLDHCILSLDTAFAEDTWMPMTGTAAKRWPRACTIPPELP